jgi:hypothetical protein
LTDTSSPELPHSLMPIPLKCGLGMRNLHHEMSIYQNINNKATMSSYLDFC